MRKYQAPTLPPLVVGAETPAGHARHAAQFLAVASFKAAQLGPAVTDELRDDLTTANDFLWRCINALEGQ